MKLNSKHEIWVPVKNNEHYHVSNLGRVKSLSRSVRSGPPGGFRVVEEKILKPWVISGTGYLQVALKNRVKHSVHRLVLLSFVGECPNGMECAHKDGDRTNCKLSNLRWASKIDNCKDRVLHGTETKGERNGMSKICANQIPIIRADPRPRVVVAKEYGVTPEAISSIVHRKNWAWVP